MKTLILVFISVLFTTMGCKAQSGRESGVKENEKNVKVTFVELGSVNCIPCKQMQPVMEAVEDKYGDQLRVVFYDVWTQEGRPYADQYEIQVIPTQVFLDENGKEFFRHQGLFPEEEIIELLKTKGVK